MQDIKHVYAKKNTVLQKPCQDCNILYWFWERSPLTQKCCQQQQTSIIVVVFFVVFFCLFNDSIVILMFTHTKADNESTFIQGGMALSVSVEMLGFC